MLLKTDSHPIKHCFTESKLTRRSIALINNPKFHSLSREKKFSKIIKFESSSHHLFPAREIESAFTRSFTLFGKLSCSLREQSVRNRFSLSPKDDVSSPPPPFDAPLEILIGDTHVLGACKPAFGSEGRRGNNFLPSFQ